jgi:regulatory protein
LLSSVFICVHLWLNFSVPYVANRRKLSTEHQLNMSAQRALMRRAHSIHEMKQYLERRAENKDLIPVVIARLRELNYLDDARYALEFARHHARLRRQGRYRIARDLRARGVPDRHIQAALDAVFTETDEASLVRARLKRRLSHLRGKLEQRKLASLYRSLLAAGFSSDVIRAELKGITHGDLPEFPDVSPDEP